MRLYMNDNNGYTYFEDGQRVESKENRTVLFPSNLLMLVRHVQTQI